MNAKLLEDFVSEVEATVVRRKAISQPSLSAADADVSSAAKLFDDLAARKRKQSMEESRQKALQHMAAKKQRA